MNFNFVVTASFFAILGYGLCYIALAHKKETENDTEFDQDPQIYHSL